MIETEWERERKKSVKARQGERDVGGFEQRGKMLYSGRLCGRLLPVRSAGMSCDPSVETVT